MSESDDIKQMRAYLDKMVALEEADDESEEDEEEDEEYAALRQGAGQHWDSWNFRWSGLSGKEMTHALNKYEAGKRLFTFERTCLDLLAEELDLSLRTHK